MKRFVLLLLFLVPALVCGQRRTYIHKGDNYDDIFIVNIGTDEKPELEVSFQMMEVTDSVFLVIKEKDLADANRYFHTLKDTFENWSSYAKRNKVEEFKKEFDIYPPECVIRWVTHPESLDYWEWSTIKIYQTKPAHEFPIEFRVAKGFTSIMGFFDVIDEKDESIMNPLIFTVTRDILMRAIKWTNRDAVYKVYIKRAPRRSTSQEKALFG